MIYGRRAWPWGWIVVKGSQGHFPEQTHVAWVEQVAELIPQGAEVISLGDGEFDGITLQATADRHGWAYAFRTAKDTVLTEEEEEFNVASGERNKSRATPFFKSRRYHKFTMNHTN